MGLRLEQPAVFGVLERLGPERSQVDPGHLRRVDHLAKRPHEGAVDTHQLLGVHLVGLVEDHADLVVLPAERLDGLRELVGDVQLVGVEQEDDPVHALAEPAQNLGEVVA